MEIILDEFILFKNNIRIKKEKLEFARSCYYYSGCNDSDWRDDLLADNSLFVSTMFGRKILEITFLDYWSLL